MDMGIVNAQHCESDVYEKLDKELLGFIEDVLLNRHVMIVCLYFCLAFCLFLRVTIRACALIVASRCTSFEPISFSSCVLLMPLHLGTFHSSIIGHDDYMLEDKHKTANGCCAKFQSTATAGALLIVV